MPRAAVDISGLKFGRLRVLSRVVVADNRPYWHCLCDCGTMITVRSKSLRSGNTKSCGCLHLETNRTNRVTHGMSYTPEYRIWCHMLGRCNNPKSSDFKYYGGRGIRVCNRWSQSFADFYSDVGPRPSPKHSIDRINNDKNYEPINCKWSTHSEQMKNRRPDTYNARERTRSGQFRSAAKVETM